MSELQRYGLEWKSEKDFVCHPMEDGYWTPWHIATEEITRLQSEVERLRGRCSVHESRLGDYEEYMERVPSMILSRQAEAVEDAIDKLRSEHNNIPGTVLSPKEWALLSGDLRFLERHAQRLRQQAAESENGN